MARNDASWGTVAIILAAVVFVILLVLGVGAFFFGARMQAVERERHAVLVAEDRAQEARMIEEMHRRQLEEALLAPEEVVEELEEVELEESVNLIVRRLLGGTLAFDSHGDWVYCHRDESGQVDALVFGLEGTPVPEAADAELAVSGDVPLRLSVIDDEQLVRLVRASKLEAAPLTAADPQRAGSIYGALVDRSYSVATAWAKLIGDE